ncbi:MAG: hypothetical protein ACREMJ_06795 [Gemmatimonadales bacterium]
MFFSPFSVPIVLFIAIAAAAILRGPIGKAVADRIAGRSGAPPPRQDDVLAAVDELRREVAELAERVDFTERLLAKQREAERLAPPR